MAWLTIFSTTGASLCTLLGYLVHIVYAHRRKINELRKQCVVSSPKPTRRWCLSVHCFCWHDWQPMPRGWSFARTAVTSRFMHPITGGPNLISMNGDEWKYWRSLFNPGFSTGAMLDNVPHVVDSVLVFRERLIARVGKRMFS